MALEKKPVDRAPLCDPAYVRRIDPLWVPGPVPSRFWEVGANRRDYLLWVGHRFGFRCMEDFYRLDLKACYRRKYGGGLGRYWGQSPLKALQDCFPAHDWKPWLFTRVPLGFWDSPANRRSYLDWLGQRLGYRCLDDWYSITMRTFLGNRGSWVIDHYGSSPARVVMDLIPRRKWCEWKFRHVPQGFWEVAENRHRYLRWLGTELGFRRPKDWYRIQARDFVRRHGHTLLQMYASLYDLMHELLPQLDWDRLDKRRPIRIEEVLAWADAHHARHGKWPTTESGEIPGTGRTWRAIDHCLRSGSRGLPARTSLSKFLEKHRGARVGRRPPDLSEEQILRWAKAAFKATGRWPAVLSGPIGQSPGNTWLAIDKALRSGGRGLRGGSSLAQLLRRHGLK